MATETPDSKLVPATVVNFEALDKAFSWIGRTPVSQEQCMEVARLKNNFAVGYHNLRRWMAELEKAQA